MVTKGDITTELELVEKAKNGELKFDVNFYFEYTDKGSSADSFHYAIATTDEATRKSMLERLLKTFSASAVSQFELNRFDILRNDENTFYYLEQNEMDSADLVIDKISSAAFNYADDLSVLGKRMEKVKGAIIEVKIETDNVDEFFYLFTKVETFNSFKKGKLPLTLGNIDNDGVRNLTDSNMLFGIRDNIGFYFHNDHFLVNSKADFERMLFLSNEYKKQARNIATELQQFNSVLNGVEQLGKDLDGQGGIILSRMLMRVSIETLKMKFESKEKIGETLSALNDIITDERFEEDFAGLQVDLDKQQIIYSNDNKFAFVALITDRAAETLFLGRKIMD